MLTTMIALMMTLQTAPGAVIWEQPAAPPPPPAATSPAPDLPDWARTDPFGWERSQCSPLVRGQEPMEACQTRVRTDLAAVLGDDLPEALRTSAERLDCSPSADGSYALACNAPRREPAIKPAPELDCRTRPQRQGEGGVAWTQDCRPLSGSEDEGLRIRLGGRD